MIDINSPVEEVLKESEKEWARLCERIPGLDKALPKEDYLLQVKMNWLFLQSLDPGERKQYLEKKNEAMKLMNERIGGRIEKIKKDNASKSNT